MTRTSAYACVHCGKGLDKGWQDSCAVRTGKNALPRLHVFAQIRK
jgi:hypothetical protein